MKKQTENIIKKLLGSDLDLKLEHRIIIAATLIGVIVGILGATVNIFISTSLLASLLPILLLPIVFLLYYQVRYKSFNENYGLPIFIISMIALTIVWINNGGLDSGNQYTMLLVMTIGIIILPFKLRKVALISYLLFSSIVYYVQSVYPQFILGFNNETERIIDSFITNIYSSILIFLLINYLYKSYRNEHDNLNENRLKLEKLNENLISVNATRDKFFSIIAHDLRNPIYNYYVVNDLLLKQYDLLTDEEILEFLELSRDSSKNLHQMLENLLTLVKSNQGIVPINLDNYSLKHLIISNIDLLSIQAQNKHIDLINNYTGSVYVYVDRNFLDSILRNLISNSIKFTNENGKIEISVTENDNSVEVSIKDNGVGMNEEIKSKLFKIDSSITSIGTNDERGSGLGLLLVKEFIDKMGCEIWVDSTEGVGTTFTFTLKKSTNQLDLEQF